MQSGESEIPVSTNVVYGIGGNFNTVNVAQVDLSQNVIELGDESHEYEHVYDYIQQ